MIRIYGFTQDQNTLDYMIVLDYLEGSCVSCYEYNKWCKECNAKRFQQDFSNWTSGNQFIDKFIQEIQLNAQEHNQTLEWIPYNRIEDIDYLDKGGFSTVYKAIWLDSPIIKWSIDERKWIRLNRGLSMDVALKSLNNSSNLSNEFLNEV